MSSTWTLRCQEQRGTLWGTELKPEAAGSGLRCSRDRCLSLHPQNVITSWLACVCRGSRNALGYSREEAQGIGLELWTVKGSSFCWCMFFQPSKSLTQLKARLFLSSLGTCRQVPLRAQLLPGLDRSFGQQLHPLGSCVEQLESQFCAGQRLGGGFSNFLQPEQCFERMNRPVTIPPGLLAAYQLGPVSCPPPSLSVALLRSGNWVMGGAPVHSIDILTFEEWMCGIVFLCSLQLSCPVFRKPSQRLVLSQCPPLLFWSCYFLISIFK